VTVTGVFRGANLFEDLPPESRRDESDWVLQDGPFSIWVTGKAPKGKGFALDPRSRSDCRYRLEATGKVSTANGFIYLRASSLQPNSMSARCALLGCTAPITPGVAS